MTNRAIPENLRSLNLQEEELREKALEMLENSPKLVAHLRVAERTMNMAEVLRKFETNDEDLKVIQILSMRMFNAFGACIKLALSGYSQNGALILRDVLETVFLVDLFSHDHKAINRWRFAHSANEKREFQPINVRKALDERDGFTEQKRGAQYKLFSELAGHPSMKSAFMMRPEKNGDAVIGPFIEATSLEAVLSETGKLAVQVGGKLEVFFPDSFEEGTEACKTFLEVQKEWLEIFYQQSGQS